MNRLNLASAAIILVLGAAGARGDVYYLTLQNVTFSATCIGGTGTCTEVVNGTFLFDPARGAFDIAAQLTGSLNVTDFSYGSPTCTSPLCLTPPVGFDANVLPNHNPIEFSAGLSSFDAPTPEPLDGGPNGTLLFVPLSCGGDQPLCGTVGAFPGGADYQLTSGTYTSVDVSTPEPNSVILLGVGIAIVSFARRKLHIARKLHF